MELNKIYCEDCFETMGRMDDNFIDLTVTSPPYDNLRTYNDNIDETWDETVWKPIIKELYRVTKEGGVVVWVVGDATIDGSETGVSFKQALSFIDVGFRLHDTMIYKKDSSPFPDSNRYYQCFEYMFVFTKESPKTFNAIKDRENKYLISKNYSERQKNGDLKKGSVKTAPKMSTRYNIWEYSVGYLKHSSDKNSYEHPATFPEKLSRDHIYSWSNEGDLVYDPFMGSGTTAKMAHLLKRNWIGSEISEEYVDLAYKRLQPYLSQKTLF